MKNEIVLTREEAQRLLVGFKTYNVPVVVGRKDHDLFAEEIKILEAKLSAEPENGKCVECGGGGMAIVGPPYPSYERCPTCNGTGRNG